MKHWRGQPTDAFRIVAVAALIAATGPTATAQRIRDLPPSARGVRMPALSQQAAAGQAVFDAQCASCHGRYGLGTDKGPPFLDPVYNPGHHSDDSFRAAVKQGVRQHHWRFGDMPPQPQVSDEQLAQIVRYVRELQQANGIRFVPHRM
jgi:mono/diheme cytochrome c family protein